MKNKETIITSPFRLAFPEVFEPRATVEGGTPKYSVTMLFPKTGAPLIPSLPGDGILAIRKLLRNAIVAKWGEDTAKWPPILRSLDLKTHVGSGKDGWPVRDGDLVTWDGFADHLFVRASSQFAPSTTSATLKPVINPADVYGGLIARAQVHAYAYDNAGNRGVTLGLDCLQILKDDGVSFGGKSDACSVFDAFGSAGQATTTEQDPW